MPYAPPAPLVNDYDTVATFDLNRTAIATAYAVNGLAPSNNVWPAVNQAIIVPFWVAASTTVAQFFLQTATASGNVDFAIYDTNFVRLVSSGSTAAAAPMTVADVTDYVLSRGNYYFGIACDNTTISIRRNVPSAQYTRCLGLLKQASAFPLPATATPVATDTGIIPMAGFTTRSTAL